MITDEDKERVRQATDMLQLVGETVELRRRGGDWWGCCPFHHEKSPSFHVNPSTGLWKCFGCGLGGDLYAYVMQRENLDFPDSIRFLADRAGIELQEERGARRGPKRRRLLDCLEAAESYYVMMLNRGKGSGPAQSRSYLAGRGFGSQVCRKWSLGYAPGHSMLCGELLGKGFTFEELEAVDLAVMRGGRPADRFYDRVMFPIHDEQGRPIGFGGRVLTDAKPKYLNTRETQVFHKGKHLFAFDKAKEHIVAQGEAIVCEGYTDVMAMHESGFPIAVAALGTSFSQDHVRLLSRFARRIVCLFDGDAAGQRAAERAIQFLDKTEADIRCVVLPDGMDPAEYLVAEGSEEMRRRLDESEPLMSFVLRKRLAGVGPSSPAGARASMLDELAGLLAPLKQSVFLDEYSLEVADRLGIPAVDVKQAIRNKPVQRDDSQGPQRGRASVTSATVSDRGGDYDYDSGYGSAYEEYVPDDYLPAEAWDSAGGSQPPRTASQVPAGLSNEERMQLQSELELLSLLAARPTEIKPYADRIATFSWLYERNETMAWAMLATPEDATPAEVVRAAESVVPEASSILASGRVASSEGISEESKVAFVVDTVELYSTRQKVRELRARIRAGDEGTQGLFQEATRLQQHANEISKRISGYTRR